METPSPSVNVQFGVKCVQKFVYIFGVCDRTWLTACDKRERGGEEDKTPITFAKLTKYLSTISYLTISAPKVENTNSSILCIMYILSMTCKQLQAFYILKLSKCQLKQGYLALRSRHG